MTTGKKVLIAGALAAVALAGFFGVRWYLNRGVVEVQAGRVVRQDLAQVVTASGEIKPRNYINIGANNMGRITEILVEEGDRVKKGQMLAKLETVQPAAELDAQKAALELMRAEMRAAEAAVISSDANIKTQAAALRRAQAELERARINFDRASQLLEDRLIARQEYDQRKADLETARASVEENKARLEQFKAQRRQFAAQFESAQRRVEQQEAQLRRVADVLRKHYSISPIDGIVTNLPVRAGETVVPGIQNSPASLIMTIADMSLITAEVRVDETDIVYVRLGQPAEVSVDALPDEALSGSVIEIGNTALLRGTGLAASQSEVASQEAKDFKVVVALDDPPGTIRPGMSCTARITTATRENVLTIPIQALTVRVPSELEDSQESSGALAAAEPEGREEIEGVFVLDDGRANFVPVETGITGASHLEVLGGLQGAETIVTGNYRVLRTLRAGAKVRIEEPGGEED